MVENKLSYKEIWNGTYRGINFEIVHWRMGWNYYLFIPKNQLPDDVKESWDLVPKETEFGGKTRYHFDYYEHPVMSEIEWHGGITLYEKHYDERGNVSGFKLGCDYMHLWDEGKYYTADIVEKDAKNTIDSLYDFIPNIKLRCSWNGEYYNQDEVYYTDKGVCVALVNKEAWEKPLCK